MIVKEMIGDVKNLVVYYEGTGDPKDDHKIIGIAFVRPDENGETRIGNHEKMGRWRKSI